MKSCHLCIFNIKRVKPVTDFNSFLLMALNSLYCADVPLSNYLLIHSTAFLTTISFLNT